MTASSSSSDRSPTSHADVVFSFEGLIRKTPFVARIRELLTLLEANLGTPVDIEFAYDGEDFYLLQCRPQSYSGDAVPVSIPQDLPTDKVIFSANRFVSNGKVPEITHIVYVDLEGYSQLSDQADMRDVGRAVGRLNKLLPKRQFILIGPGRWGSRGDIKLGRSGHVLRHQQHCHVDRSGPAAGKLPSRPVLRHPFFSRLGGSVDSLSAALSG